MIRNSQDIYPIISQINARKEITIIETKKCKTDGVSDLDGPMDLNTEVMMDSDEEILEHEGPQTKTLSKNREEASTHGSARLGL